MRQFTAEQRAERLAAGLARMAADPSSTKRPNQHAQPCRRASKTIRSGEQLAGYLRPLSQKSAALYTFDGNAIHRTGKPDRRKKNRRAARAGRKPYVRPLGPGPAEPQKPRVRTVANPTAGRLAAVKGAIASLTIALRGHSLHVLDRSRIANRTDLSLAVVQDALFALYSKPYAKRSRTGFVNLPRRKQKWRRADRLAKRQAEEIKGWPKDKALPRRLQRVVDQRRKLREARDAR